MHVCMYLCTHVCIYACIHVCMFACMPVCMFDCLYVRMYVSHLRSMYVILESTDTPCVTDQVIYVTLLYHICDTVSVTQFDICDTIHSRVQDGEDP